MLKKQLRLSYKKLRKTTSAEAVQSLSLLISNKLLEVPIWSMDYYHLFLQIPEQKEVDTSFILSILQGKDKNVVIPKIQPQNRLSHYLLTDNTLFKNNRWNIPEPVNGIEILPSKIDLVFVPLLAFDYEGHRVGYGKGYYDNFLRECRAETLKIGLSFFEATEKITDIHENDIPLDFCVTPKKIYEF